MKSLDGWSLGCAIDDGQHHTISEIRALSRDEVGELDAALRFIDWTTNGSHWNDVLEAWDVLRQARATSSTGVPAVDGATFRLFRALTAFSHQFDTVPSEVPDLERVVVDADSSEWPVFSASLASGALVEPVPLVRIATVQSKPGQTQRTMVLTPSAVAWLGLAADPDATLDRALARVMTAAQARQTLILASSFEGLSAAIITVKTFAAEIAFGRPILVRVAEASDGQWPISMRDLSLDVLPLLSVAIDRARRTRAFSESSKESTPPATPRSEEAQAARTPEPSDTSLPGTTEQQMEPNWHALDPAGLFMHSMRLSRATEKRWSAALAEAIRDETIAEDFQQWHALLTSEWSNVGASDDAVSVTWPISPSEAAQLDHADPRTTYLAYLAGLDQLARSLNSLSEPSMRELVIENGKGHLSAWWSSGGFATVRDAAHLLLRTANSLQPTESSAGTFGIPEQLRLPESGIWIACARRAIECGLPEAALVYATYAFDAWTDRPETLQSPRRQAALEQVIAALPAVRQTLERLVQSAPPIAMVNPLATAVVDSLDMAMTATEIRLRPADESHG